MMLLGRDKSESSHALGPEIRQALEVKTPKTASRPQRSYQSQRRRAMFVEAFIQYETTGNP